MQSAVWDIIGFFLGKQYDTLQCFPSALSKKSSNVAVTLIFLLFCVSRLPKSTNFYKTSKSKMIIVLESHESTLEDKKFLRP